MAWRGLAPVDRLPEHLRRPVATQWLGPNGHVTCYPVHRGTLLNMVGEVERDDWQLEFWVEPGSHEECLQDFPGWHRDLLDIIDSIDQLYKWGLFLREPLPKWSVGRVSLLGDSCHAMLPFLGQGGNMAIEDGYVLGALRRQISGRPGDRAAALRSRAARAHNQHRAALREHGRDLPQRRPVGFEAGASYISSQLASGQDQDEIRHDLQLQCDLDGDLKLFGCCRSVKGGLIEVKARLSEALRISLKSKLNSLSAGGGRLRRVSSPRCSMT